ncbi:hypothetical protein AWB78_02882 [Caballeronia calidae]|uniref:Uncharacterized protein n=1 Tax=Caballeronia calidae TaxID=1777139 RepID=A0A158BMW6_9BURK|nr:hypothetical protein [Caballeronia calidae]SAK71418.1 hypothetical protein AWB78_02882 [Caballeronia calidae]
MKRNKLPTVVRASSLVIASILIGAAMTRFILLESGMMSYWTASLLRSVLEALRVEEPIGIEVLMNADLLVTLLICWLVAALIMFAAARFTRNVVTSAWSFPTLIVCTFSGAYIVAGWLKTALLAPASYIEPDDFRVPYHATMILSCWAGMLAAALALLFIIRRLHARWCSDADNV